MSTTRCRPNRHRAGHRRSLLGVAVLGISVVATVSCATTEPLAPPDVTLADLDFVEATLFESTLDVAVRLFNENPEPMIIDGAVIKLELDGKRFGKGAIDERFEIPRLDSVVRRFEMHLSHVAVATKIKGVIESETVNYSITGKIYVVTPSGAIRRLPFDKRGTIELRGEAPGLSETGLDSAGAIED